MPYYLGSVTFEIEGTVIRSDIIRLIEADNYGQAQMKIDKFAEEYLAKGISKNPETFKGMKIKLAYAQKAI